jgi:protein gp37
MTNIEWTDETWNIAVGCTKVDHDCKYCYMYRESLNNTRYDPKVVRKTKTVFDKPLRIKKPSRIFVSSLTDPFHPDCDAFRNEMWDIIRKCPQHTFQILTKRTERIGGKLPEDWGDGWDNVWLGTSVGHFRSLSRVVELKSFISKTRFLSLEPLYGPIDLRWILRSRMKCPTCIGNGYILINGEPLFCPSCGHDYRNMMGLSPFHWVIVGGESGNEAGKYRYRPCKLEWIESIILDCKNAGVPVFIKQLGTHLARELGLKDRHGRNMAEWPEHLRIREFPTEKKQNLLANE